MIDTCVSYSATCFSFAAFVSVISFILFKKVFILAQITLIKSKTFIRLPFMSELHVLLPGHHTWVVFLTEICQLNLPSFMSKLFSFEIGLVLKEITVFMSMGRIKAWAATTILLSSFR